MPDNKPYNGEWSHFREVAWTSTGEPTRYQCRYCPWAQGANATRLKEHYQKRHAHEVEDETGDQPRVKKKKHQLQKSITTYMDPHWSAHRQNLAETRLALLQATSAVPYSVLENEAMVHFCKALRPDFHLPSRRTLQRRVSDLYTKCKEQVESNLKSAKHVALAIDGWETHLKEESVCCTAQALGNPSRPLLVDFEGQVVRQTAENLKEYVKKVIEQVPCKVVAICSDNGANMVKALQLIEEETGILATNCMAHSAQLLLKDLATVWPSLITKTRQVEQFFRLCHYARSCYVEEMEKNGGTILTQVCETRWATEYQCLGSLLRNRVTVENTLSRYAPVPFANFRCFFFPLQAEKRTFSK